MKTSINFANNFELYEFVDNGIYLQALHSVQPPALIVHRNLFTIEFNIRATFVKKGVYRIIDRDEYKNYHNITYDEWKLVQAVSWKM